jgi:hypothetical protein
MALITYERMRLCVHCGLLEQPYFNIILQFLLLLKSLILGGQTDLRLSYIQVNVQCYNQVIVL